MDAVSRGRFFEKRAQRWLCRNYRVFVLFQNFRTRSGEIDLIYKESFLEKEVLVFGEIRVRTGRMVSGIETVNKYKQFKIKRVARVFLSRDLPGYDEIRFDVIEGNGHEWKLYRGAY